MTNELKIALIGFIVMVAGIVGLVAITSSGPDAEVISRNIQEISKSCIETHNGTFTVKFMVGDINQIEYQCVIGAK